MKKKIIMGGGSGFKILPKKPDADKRYCIIDNQIFTIAATDYSRQDKVGVITYKNVLNGETVQKVYECNKFGWRDTIVKIRKALLTEEQAKFAII